jgi:hypothetical protein
MRSSISFAALPVALASLLVACSDKPANGEDSLLTADDTAVDYGDNPIVPEEFQYLWDVDASGCADDTDAIVYHMFTGAVNTAGKLRGEEAWYWFFKTPGWDDDCVDTFDVDTEATDTNWADDPCSGCDLEFSGTWDLADEKRTCPGYDYEDFFANDKVSADHYNVIVMLDPLSPGGNPNQTTLVMAAFEDDDNPNSYSFNADFARGDYVPDVEGDYEGSAAVTWVPTAGTCVTFNSNG